MLTGRNLRWAGSGISNGRQRLMDSPGSTRHYTINAARTYSPRFTRPTLQSKTIYSQQARSISLFGWGNSKSANIDASAVPSDATGIDIGPNSLSSVRTVKASHATSDIPDPSSPHLPHPPVSALEPQVIENIQEAITFPSGSERFEEVSSSSTEIVTEVERLGYLKEVCGLDFGWGPTAVMEWTLEHLHMSFGLSWAASIIVLSCALRAVMVQPMIMSQKESAKMKEIQPILGPLREKSSEYLKAGNRAKAMEITQQVRLIQKEADIKMSRAFVPMLIQFPFQYGAFRLLRTAGTLPVPGFSSESWLWIKSLSLSDPIYLAPAISSFFIYFQFKQAQAAQTTTGAANAIVTPNMMKLLGTALPAVSFVFMIWQPGSVQMYFMISSVWAFGTSWFLRQDWFRKRVGLPQVQGPKEAEAEAAAAVAKKAAIKAMPGGLRREPYQPYKTVSEPQPEEPIKNVSAIDKGVDLIKEKVSSVKKMVRLEESTKKAQEKAKEAAKLAADQEAARFELRQRQQAERNRREKIRASNESRERV